MTTPAPHRPAPWVVIDETTALQATILFERLADWLAGHERPPAECTRALSLGKTDDPLTVARWADALAARLSGHTDTGHNQAPHQTVENH